MGSARSLQTLFVCALALLLPAAASEGTKPKAAATDYPAHVEAPGVALAGELMLRSVLTPGRTAHLPEHIAVEVALFPAAGKEITVSSSHFRLRLNGSKGVLYPVSVSWVEASVRYPDWEQRRNLEVQTGPVVIGRQPQVPRFPGDERRPRYPAGQSTTTQDDSGQSVIAEAALREGPARTPVSGYLYFSYKGKIEKLKKIELLYEPVSGSQPIVLGLR